MKRKGVGKVRLEWRRCEPGYDKDYDSGLDFEFRAHIPFELEYVVYYDDSEYTEEMHDEYLLSEARGMDSIPAKEWRRIRKRHGEPSEALKKWRVDLNNADTIFGAGDLVFQIGCGLSADEAKAVALEDYKLRVAAAVAGFPLY